MSWSEFLLSFKGRVGRKLYWIFWLIQTVVSFSAIAFSVIIEYLALPPIIIIVFSFAFIGVMAWSYLAVHVKRWHDRGKSGWWMLIGLIPFFGGLWTLVECGFLRGTEGPNRFGDAPQAPPTFA